MPELPEHRHRPHHSPLHSGGTGRGLSLSLFRLPPSQMGVRPPQGDAGVVRMVEEESKATARMLVRSNMC